MEMDGKMNDKNCASEGFWILSSSVHPNIFDLYLFYLFLFLSDMLLFRASVAKSCVKHHEAEFIHLKGNKMTHLQNQHTGGSGG